MSGMGQAEVSASQPLLFCILGLVGLMTRGITMAGEYIIMIGYSEEYRISEVQRVVTWVHKYAPSSLYIVLFSERS